MAGVDVSDDQGTPRRTPRVEVVRVDAALQTTVCEYFDAHQKSSKEPIAMVAAWMTDDSPVIHCARSFDATPAPTSTKGDATGSCSTTHATAAAVLDTVTDSMSGPIPNYFFERAREGGKATEKRLAGLDGAELRGLLSSYAENMDAGVLRPLLAFMRGAIPDREGSQCKDCTQGNPCTTGCLRHFDACVERAVVESESPSPPKQDRPAPSSLTKLEVETVESMRVSPNRVIMWLDVYRTARVRQSHGAMRTLMENFESAANVYGQTIIMELTLPEKMKSIREYVGDIPFQLSNLRCTQDAPVYFVNGLWFLFASDVAFGDNNQRNTITGERSAQRELVAISETLNVLDNDFMSVPMVTIRYCGHMLVCSMDVPSMTRAYGPKTARDPEDLGNPLFEDAMSTLCSRLNIRSPLQHHFVPGVSGYLTPGALPVLGPCANILPRDLNFEDDDEFHPGATLRPEVLRRFDQPIVLEGADGQPHDTHISACDYLKTHFAKKFGQKIDEWDNDKVKFYPTSIRISALMHDEGLNVRYLPMVRCHVDKESQWNLLLLVEMMARTMKRMLRFDLRLYGRRLASPQVKISQHIDSLVKWLNKAFGNNRESHRWWNNEFKSTLLSLFPGALDEDELSEDLWAMAWSSPERKTTATPISPIRQGTASSLLVAPKLTKSSSSGGAAPSHRRGSASNSAMHSMGAGQLSQIAFPAVHVEEEWDSDADSERASPKRLTPEKSSPQAKSAFELKRAASITSMDMVEVIKERSFEQSETRRKATASGMLEVGRLMPAIFSRLMQDFGFTLSEFIDNALVSEKGAELWNDGQPFDWDDIHDIRPMTRHINTVDFLNANHIKAVAKPSTHNNIRFERKVEDSFNTVERWLSQYPHHVDSLLLKSYLLDIKGELDAAEEYLRKAVNMASSGSEDAELSRHLQLGLLFEQRGNRDEALKCYMKGLEICPYEETTLASTTQLMRDGDDLAGAVAIHQKALKTLEGTDRDDIRFRVMAGLEEALREAGRDEEADEVSKEVRQLGMNRSQGVTASNSPEPSEGLADRD